MPRQKPKALSTDAAFAGGPARSSCELRVGQSVGGRSRWHHARTRFANVRHRLPQLDIGTLQPTDSPCLTRREVGQIPVLYPNEVGACECEVGVEGEQLCQGIIRGGGSSDLAPPLFQQCSLIPSSTVDCSGRFSRRTNLQPPSSFVALSALSITYLVTTSRTRVSELQPEACHKTQKPGDQEELVLTGDVEQLVRGSDVDTRHVGIAVSVRASHRSRLPNVRQFVGAEVDGGGLHVFL